MRNVKILFVLLCFFSCAPKKESLEGATVFRKGKKLTELKEKKLGEVSGLAASVANTGLLWTHNDSGNGAEVFLIDRDLDIKQTYVLGGITNRDWEDITVGPGPDATKQYVYIAEIGDNDAVYQLKHIYRFEEPTWESKQDEITITDFDTITFQLPDERKDTEALLIDPATRDLFIISKREEPVWVYRLKYPYSTRDTLLAEAVGSLPLTQIVAGDVSPNGREILLKNYNHIYYWNNAAGNSIVSVLLHEKPVEVPYEVEPQGESIAWARDGSGFFTISERNPGKKSFLYFYRRR